MNNRGYGTYEDLENGFTKDGDVAGDYLEAGRNPNLPRQLPCDVEESVAASTPKSDSTDSTTHENPNTPLYLESWQTK